MASIVGKIELQLFAAQRSDAVEVSEIIDEHLRVLADTHNDKKPFDNDNLLILYLR